MIFREPSILFHRDFTLKKYNSCITAAGAGRVSATAADDGLVANDGVLISGGTLAVTSGGGSANTAVKTGNAMFGGWDAGTAEEETASTPRAARTIPRKMGCSGRTRLRATPPSR